MITAIFIGLIVGGCLILGSAGLFVFLLYRMGERLATLQRQVNELQGQVNAALTSAQGAHQMAERALALVSQIGGSVGK